jgi:hypothetical protein
MSGVDTAAFLMSATGCDGWMSSARRVAHVMHHEPRGVEMAIARECARPKERRHCI